MKKLLRNNIEKLNKIALAVALVSLVVTFGVTGNIKNALAQTPELNNEQVSQNIDTFIKGNIFALNGSLDCGELVSHAIENPSVPPVGTPEGSDGTPETIENPDYNDECVKVIRDRINTEVQKAGESVRLKYESQYTDKYFHDLLTNEQPKFEDVINRLRSDVTSSNITDQEKTTTSSDLNVMEKIFDDIEKSVFSDITTSDLDVAEKYLDESARVALEVSIANNNYIDPSEFITAISESDAFDDNGNPYISKLIFLNGSALAGTIPYATIYWKSTDGTGGEHTCDKRDSKAFAQYDEIDIATACPGIPDKALLDFGAKGGPAGNVHEKRTGYETFSYSKDSEIIVGYKIGQSDGLHMADIDILTAGASDDIKKEIEKTKKELIGGAVSIGVSAAMIVASIAMGAYTSMRDKKIYTERVASIIRVAKENSGDFRYALNNYFSESESVIENFNSVIASSLREDHNVLFDFQYAIEEVNDEIMRLGANKFPFENRVEFFEEILRKGGNYSEEEIVKLSRSFVMLNSTLSDLRGELNRVDIDALENIYGFFNKYEIFSIQDLRLALDSHAANFLTIKSKFKISTMRVACLIGFGGSGAAGVTVGGMAAADKIVHYHTPDPWGEDGQSKPVPYVYADANATQRVKDVAFSHTGFAHVNPIIHFKDKEAVEHQVKYMPYSHLQFGLSNIIHNAKGNYEISDSTIDPKLICEKDNTKLCDFDGTEIPDQTEPYTGKKYPIAVALSDNGTQLNKDDTKAVLDKLVPGVEFWVTGDVKGGTARTNDASSEDGTPKHFIFDDDSHAFAGFATFGGKTTEDKIYNVAYGAISSFVDKFTTYSGKNIDNVKQAIFKLDSVMSATSTNQYSVILANNVEHTIARNKGEVTPELYDADAAVLKEAGFDSSIFVNYEKEDVEKMGGASQDGKYPVTPTKQSLEYLIVSTSKAIDEENKKGEQADASYLTSLNKILNNAEIALVQVINVGDTPNVLSYTADSATESDISKSLQVDCDSKAGDNANKFVSGAVKAGNQPVVVECNATRFTTDNGAKAQTYYLSAPDSDSVGIGGNVSSAVDVSNPHLRQAITFAPNVNRITFGITVGANTQEQLAAIVVSRFADAKWSKYKLAGKLRITNALTDEQRADIASAQAVQSQLNQSFMSKLDEIADTDKAECGDIAANILDEIVYGDKTWDKSQNYTTLVSCGISPEQAFASDRKTQMIEASKYSYDSEFSLNDADIIIHSKNLSDKSGQE